MQEFISQLKKIEYEIATYGTLSVSVPDIGNTKVEELLKANIKKKRS
jgi:ferritin-like metal-binding protein YciE